MKKSFKSMVPEPFMLMMCLLVFANLSIIGKKKESQGDAGTTITLVTSGTGNTKEEATKNALRSALEQTYGAFVSANSQVVNDELVRDEIVSISTGNIVSYDVLSFIDSNPKQITLKAVVSISKLQSYAQNKGMSAELAGNTFAMNLKMDELNKNNQDIALKHLLEQTKLMSQNLFDYEISVGNPEKTHGEFPGVQVPVTIRIKANKNTLAYYDLFHNTLSSLAVNKGKDLNLHGKQGIEIPGFEQFDGKGIVYELRGEARDPNTYNTLFEICNSIGEAVLNCEIVDNLGNVSGFEKKETYSGVTSDYATTNKLSFKYSGGTGRSYTLRGYRDEYKKWDGIIPIQRLTRVSTNGFYFWMNAVKPKVGEKLYGTKLFLMYSPVEIEKISKIEIRPKKNNVMSNNAAQHFAQKQNVEKVDHLLDLKQKAKNYSDKEDYENAIAAYKKYLDACGEKASATDIAALGQQYMYYAQQNPAQKVDALKKADDVFAKLAENPDAEEFATYKRAQVANQMDGGKGLAKPFYDKLIATPNCNIERLKEAYLYNISYFGNVKGDINAAIPYAEKLAKIDPNNQIAKVVLSLK